ncbi:MAG TPA: hypothetical protein DIT48_06745 [Actinobacteria bacterium]|nr:hypothetical protein [Actinomycetota bacterium]
MLGPVIVAVLLFAISLVIFGLFYGDPAPSGLPPPRHPPPGWSEFVSRTGGFSLFAPGHATDVADVDRRLGFTSHEVTWSGPQEVFSELTLTVMYSDIPPGDARHLLDLLVADPGIKHDSRRYFVLDGHPCVDVTEEPVGVSVRRIRGCIGTDQVIDMIVDVQPGYEQLPDIDRFLGSLRMFDV